MFNLIYPNVLNVEVAASQPKPADIRSIEYMQSNENTSFATVSYIVKINLGSNLPVTSLGLQLYVGDYHIRKYSGFKNGIYFKINNPHFFSEHYGKEIRFSLDGGETFHHTGVYLPHLIYDRQRSIETVDMEGLPTQEEVLQ